MRRAAPALALLLAGCATTALAPRTGRAVAVEDPDEQGLWRLAAEAQVGIERSGRVQPDPALDAYLEEVARRLEPPEVFAAIPFRIRVIRDRTPNAFCLPNGGIYLHTGILALMESETELASLLGHEMSHAVHRHALRGMHNAQNSGAWLNALGSVVGAGARPGGLVFMASVAGYSRDLEREADREGLARLAAAGYDAREAPRLFERMLAWVKEEKVPEGSAFYASHPNLTERVESMRTFAMTPVGPPHVPDPFPGRTAPLLFEAARTELAGGRYASARGMAERYLARLPDEARGHLLLGELGRREGGAQEGPALESYRRAVARDPGLAEAWRGLGLLLRRGGDKAGARAALERYLQLAPAAADRAHVAALVEELQDSKGGKP